MGRKIFVGNLSFDTTSADLEALFNSPYAHSVKEQICDVGRRLWQ